jgi:hypothetical protein
MTTPIRGSEGTTRVQAVEDASRSAASGAVTKSGALPDPIYTAGPPVDDLQTALAVLMIETSRDNRATADKQREAGLKAQEDAHARKIEKMKELADDSFSQALVEGVMQGVSAGAQAGAASLSYSSSMSDIASKGETCMVKSASLAQESAKLAQQSRLMEAGGRAVSATGTIASGAGKSSIEHDREDIAVAEHDVERAKGSVEGASSDSKRAQDDARETMNFIRQYLAAKTQAAQAAIIRG